MAKGGSAGTVGYNGAVDFILQDFRPEDFETLWQIDQKCFAPGIAYSRRELTAYIRRRGSFTVVARGLAADHGLPASRQPGSKAFGGILGFIVAEAGRRGVGHVISIDVLPENRRLGVGSRLLRAAEERLRVAQCETVILETAVDNASALAFYKRHCYSVAKIVPRYYSNGVDAFLMDKNLLSSEAVRQGQ